MVGGPFSHTPGPFHVATSSLFHPERGEHERRQSPLKASPLKLPLSVLLAFHWLECSHCKEDAEVGPGRREKQFAEEQGPSAVASDKLLNSHRLPHHWTLQHSGSKPVIYLLTRLPFGLDPDGQFCCSCLGHSYSWGHLVAPWGCMVQGGPVHVAGGWLGASVFIHVVSPAGQPLVLTWWQQQRSAGPGLSTQPLVSLCFDGLG